MAKTYVTFGQTHTHSVNGKTLDKDCVAVLTTASYDEGRAKAFELFGAKFCFEYPACNFNFDDMKYFPRGLIEVN